MSGEPAWLEWARTLAAVAQNGLYYATDVFDVARYTQVRKVAAAMLAAGGGGTPAELEQMLAYEQGYATPKVDVRGWVTEGDRVLLVRERSDGRWTLPGGWADPFDTPSGAVEREVAEEAGYEVRATRLLACWDRSLQQGAPPHPFRAYKLFFACAVLGEVPRDESENDAVEWHALDDLPPLSLGRVNPAQIARLRMLAAAPDLPADFH